MDISYGDKAFTIADQTLAAFKEKNIFIFSFGAKEMAFINSIFHSLKSNYDYKPEILKVLSVILFEFILRAQVYPEYGKGYLELDKAFKGLNDLQLLLDSIQKNEAEADEIVIKGKKKIYSENANKKLKQDFNISIKGDRAISLLFKIISDSKGEIDKWAGYTPLNYDMIRSKKFNRKVSLPKLRAEFASILEAFLRKNIKFKIKNDRYFFGGSLLAENGLMPVYKGSQENYSEWRVFIVSNFKKSLSQNSPSATLV